MESQSLTDFFSHTDPWLSGPAAFPPATETKESLDNFNNSWGFVPPPTIHRVSTTIPDQAHLHNFHPEHSYAPIPHSTSHLSSTADDLQAASTLFSNAQAPQQHLGRAYSYHDVPSSSANPSSLPTTGFHSLPMIPTSHGLMNEQLAALLPNHDEDGSIDAQLAAQFVSSDAQHRHNANLRELGIQRAPLKRSYTYGTDSAFDESGFKVSSPTETEEHVTRRLLSDLAHAQSLAEQAAIARDEAKSGKTSSQNDFPAGLVDIPSDEDGQSEEVTSDEEEDDDRPAKKRRKSKIASATKNGRASGGKSVSGAKSGKNRKASMDDQPGKKKRGSTAAQKPQRENLTEEQKRSNHILSEQKRRNLIKRGFDDLHELVPELKNGSLSKSNVLMEAANFLEALIVDNKKYIQMSGGEDG